MSDRYLGMLDECEESISRNVTEDLYERHLKPLFFELIEALAKSCGLGFAKPVCWSNDLQIFIRIFDVPAGRSSRRNWIGVPGRLDSVRRSVLRDVRNNNRNSTRGVACRARTRFVLGGFSRQTEQPARP